MTHVLPSAENRHSMGVISRLACKLRGGHTWEEHSDPVGTITFCRRCGVMRHTPGPDSAPELHGPDASGVGGGGT